MEYTKGEWKAGDLYIDADGDEVVDIMAHTEDCEEWVAETWCEANAHLIAAAPKLYRCCKRLAQLLRTPLAEGKEAWQVEIDELNAALAKAEGK